MNFDKDLECRVLGMCLVEPEAFRTAIQILSVNDFGFVDNQLIFVSIQSVFESTGTVDPVLVAKDLQGKGELKRIGGPIHLYDLNAVVTDTDSIKFYCEILKELSIKRKIDQICAKAKMQVSDEGVTAAEVTRDPHIRYRPNIWCRASARKHNSIGTDEHGHKTCAMGCA